MRYHANRCSQGDHSPDSMKFPDDSRHY